MVTDIFTKCKSIIFEKLRVLLNSHLGTKLRSRLSISIVFYLLKIIKLLNLTETTGTYLVKGTGLIIFEREYRDFPGIPVG
jgi:hypothetical protein